MKKLKKVLNASFNHLTKITMAQFKIIKLRKGKYPLCPECGCNTIVGYGDILEPEKCHLYCCNADKNCSFNTKFLELTTPMTEKRNNLLSIR